MIKKLSNTNKTTIYSIIIITLIIINTTAYAIPYNTLHFPDIGVKSLVVININNKFILTTKFTDTTTFISPLKIEVDTSSVKTSISKNISLISNSSTKHRINNLSVNDAINKSLFKYENNFNPRNEKNLLDNKIISNEFLEMYDFLEDIKSYRMKKLIYTTPNRNHKDIFAIENNYSWYDYLPIDKIPIPEPSTYLLFVSSIISDFSFLYIRFRKAFRADYK